MNLQQEYNNIWIKKWDKQKTAFTTLEGAFELPVIFFELTNPPAIFQTMINKILQDLINTEKVVNFINDIIVGTEIEEEHNKIVKEVVRRLVKNDLYIKLEECK